MAMEASDEDETLGPRERLYVEVGGAIIGLGAAIALINFVLLK